MNRRHRQPLTRAATLAAVLAVLWPGVAMAQGAPLRERGDRISIAAGLGLAGSQLRIGSGPAAVQPGLERGGRQIHAHAAWAPSRMLELDAGYTVFRRVPEGADDTPGEGNEDRYAGAFLAGAKLFPLGPGLYLRGGMGYGQLEATVDSTRSTGSGFAAGLGAGWQLWVRDDMTLTLRADMLRVEGELSGTLYFLGVEAALHRAREELWGGRD